MTTYMFQGKYTPESFAKLVAHPQDRTQMIRKMAERGLGAVEVREDVWTRYNDNVAREHEDMVWTHPGMTTYYRNARGRITINSPYRNVDFYAMTKEVDLDEYVAEPQRERELVAD